jgi:hypothetical protein
MPPKKPTHGGPRKGAGRPKPAQPLKFHPVRLSDTHVRLLREWSGTMAKGIRDLIEAEVQRRNG